MDTSFEHRVFLRQEKLFQKAMQSQAKGNIKENSPTN